MEQRQGQPPADVSSAPESGTTVDETSGNRTAAPEHRPAAEDRPGKKKDDPSVAGEER